MSFNANFSLHLAPMEKITDVAFRALIAKISKTKIVTYSEMLPAEGIIRGTLKPYLYQRSKYETRYGIQLFGSTQKKLIEAAKILEKEREFDIDFINFNFGCPSQHTLKSNAGGAWLKRVNELIELSKKLKQELSLPYSFKTRLGFNSIVIDEFVHLEVDELIIHGRTIKDGYRGKANWEPIYDLKSKVSFKVIGNGEIFEPRDAFEKLNNLDGIMIGRGILNNPFLFYDISKYLKKKKNTKEMKRSENTEKILERKINAWFLYYDFAREFSIDFSRLKLNSMWFLKGLPNSKEFKVKLVQAKTIDQIYDLFSDLSSKFFI